FFPKVKKEDVVVQETRDFLQRIYDGSIGMMMSALLRQNDLSKE
ncbi:MAG TPA: transcriptional regulator, partial [Lachnospiraceae bacterium]|nr:transcriptional regulator [Lachnospiraceae bacterium]